MLTVYPSYFNYFASMIPLVWGNNSCPGLDSAREMSLLFCTEEIVIGRDII